MNPKRLPEEFKLKLDSLPVRSGVYIMKGEGEGVIYIGKAKVLRNRVRSYFHKSEGDGRPQFGALVSSIADFECIVTDSEVEALILEANLIRKHKPKYNINLKDDKKYPFVRITKEPYPRILLTRNLEDDGSKYLGPYTDVSALRRTLDTLHRIFPIRTCSHRLPGQKVKRPCFDYHIKRCLAPCQDFVKPEEYLKLVRQAELFLTGRNDELAKILKKKMEKASEELNFEVAAEYRDRLADIERVDTRQKVVSHRKVDWDFISLAADRDEACGVVLEVRDGKLLDRKHYFLGDVSGSDLEDIVSAFVYQFYVTVMSIPSGIYLPCRIPGIDEFSEWLSKKRGSKVTVSVPIRGDKAKMVRMAEENADVLLEERRAKRERLKPKIPKSVEALQKDLNLPKPPLRIEAVDISNIHGREAVGSVVCFVGGRPRRSEYRRFKIKEVEGPDDFAMIREVVCRRFRRLNAEGKSFPDLLLVDGGKGQLSSALEALLELGVEDQPVVSLAKRLEEVFVPGFPEAQVIRRSSPSLKLLQNLRNEAHRFAISYHRKLRDKKISQSALDNIPRIGPARKVALLKTFGSVKGISRADISDIASVEGIGETLARSIKERLAVNGVVNSIEKGS